jgi:hypothetical protein
VEFEIEFGVGPADIEITVSGVPTPEAFHLLNERLTGDRRFRAGLALLVDCSALDTSDLTDGGLKALSDSMAERDWLYPPAAVALIAPDDQTYEAVRSYRAHLGGSRSNRRLFTSRAEALAWLEEQN